MIVVEQKTSAAANGGESKVVTEQRMLARVTVGGHLLSRFRLDQEKFERVFCTIHPPLPSLLLSTIRTGVVSQGWRGWSALALAVEKCE